MEVLPKLAVDENSNFSSQWKFKVLKSIQWQSTAWYILIIYVIVRFSSQTVKGSQGYIKNMIENT